MQGQMAAAEKLEASFPTSTTNNNNLFYTNRNAYDYEPMPDQHAEAQQKESPIYSESQLHGDGQHTVNVQLATTTAEQDAQPITTANPSGSGTSTIKMVTRPICPIPGKLSDTLRAVLEVIKKFKRHRRPVNDFLMFCKKHRGKVSAHFTEKAAPKENRFITRKLGLWWGLLTSEQKLPYKRLADKYKAMYLAAFPNYRWGKHQYHQPQEASDGEITVADQRDGSLEVARYLLEMAEGAGIPPEARSRLADDTQPMSTFRLADENQMGRLSSLMGNATGNGNQHSSVVLDQANSVGASEHNYSAVEPLVYNEAQDLHAANNRGEPCANMRQHFLAQTKPKPEQTVTSSSSSSTGPARATRTCKGKRYEAYLRQQHPARHPFSSGQNKRPRTSSSSSSNGNTTTNTPDPIPAVSVAPIDPSTPTTSRVVSVDAEDAGQELDERTILAWLDDYKKLNEEINKLPIFDLNEFLAKQKCDKRRKKPYAVSSKAARKRKTPKSSIPTPSADTIMTPSISSSPAPPPVVPPAVASVPTVTTTPVPTTPQTASVTTAKTAPLPTTPQTASVPTAMTGSVPTTPQTSSVPTVMTAHVPTTPQTASVPTMMTAPLPTIPQTSTVPAKIVGCRKRKAPKAKIIHLPVT